MPTNKQITGLKLPFAHNRHPRLSEYEICGLNMTVGEGIKQLSSLCVTEVISEGNVLCSPIPTPRAKVADLIRTHRHHASPSLQTQKSKCSHKKEAVKVTYKKMISNILCVDSMRNYQGASVRKSLGIGSAGLGSFGG